MRLAGEGGTFIFLNAAPASFEVKWLQGGLTDTGDGMNTGSMRCIRFFVVLFDRLIGYLVWIILFDRLPFLFSSFLLFFAHSLARCT